MTVTIALFTRDLRVHDNPVLTAAARAGTAVVPLFVLDETILSGRFNCPNRAAFLAAALADLDAQLRDRGGRLVLRRGRVVDEVDRIVAETGAGEAHLAADASGYSARRETRLRDRLAQRDCALHTHGQTITVVDPGMLTPSGGSDHFAVFTPYLRRWSVAPRRGLLRAPRALTVPDVRSAALPAASDICAGEPSPSLTVGGELAGRKLLSAWLSGPIDEYHSRSDDLDGSGTSGLSPHIHFGCLSPTEIVHRVDETTEGGAAFTRQVAWRDFHHQVLAARPDAATADYRPRGDRWRTDAKAWRAWRDGRTGYPVVDAGMRQLLEQGWIPGRARLICASFLTKTLYLDWRAGADHFLRWLVDGDLANNQLNWQWAAGTGTDTRPNRVLNPLRQAQRFDPDGDYVRRWVPELAGIPGRAVHTPWTSGIATPGYPPPIVEPDLGARDFRIARSAQPSLFD